MRCNNDKWRTIIFLNSNNKVKQTKFNETEQITNL